MFLPALRRGLPEPLPGPPPGFGTVLAGFDRDNVTNAVITFLLSMTGPIAILVTFSRQGVLTVDRVESFVLGGYLLGGLITFFMAWLYRQPYAVLWTIPGLLLLPQALSNLSYPEVVGAILLSGVLTMALAASGLIRAVTALLPIPIVMGMVAGVFLPLGLGLVEACGSAPLIAGAAALGYLAAGAWAPIGRWCPPLLAALGLGAAAVLATGALEPIPAFGRLLARPDIVLPAFTWRAAVELVLPLTVTVVGIHNPQAFAVFRARGHPASPNAITWASGLLTLPMALTGCVPACAASFSAGIFTSSGVFERRFVAAMLYGTLAIGLGLLAPTAIRVGLALPAALAAALAGLAMLPVLRDAFQHAFRGRCKLGALTAFLVTVSDVAPFSIGAAFWALIAGFAVSALLERADMAALAASGDADETR